MFTKVKTAAEIAAMREGGAMLAEVLRCLEDQLTPGMTGLDIDQIARKELVALGGEPAFLGYYGFPGVICISINDEVEHGTPRNVSINDGDIVSLDFGVRYKGLITDSGKTIVVGSVNTEVQNLVTATERAMFAGIEQVKHGVRVGDISAAIEEVLKEGGYGIIRDLVGHGVGHELHEDPNIPNYGTAGTGPMLKSGMTIAIEPMGTLGDYRLRMDADKWTLRTIDGSLAAHFEHTVLVTDDSYEILTTSAT